MDISLAPELEIWINEKLASGLYRDAGEVVGEALRFMRRNEDWLQLTKLEQLRVDLAKGEADLASGRFVELAVDDLGEYMQAAKRRMMFWH